MSYNDLKNLNLDVSSPTNPPLQFIGPFIGKEDLINITPDKKVSVYDLIMVVCDQSRNTAQGTWTRIIKKHQNEITANCSYYKFSNKNTPCVDTKGIVTLLMFLPGDNAKQFRAASAGVLVRYLGGDPTLIDEIKAIDAMHQENPGNVASMFRNDETVQKNLKYARALAKEEALLKTVDDRTAVNYLMMVNKDDSIIEGIDLKEGEEIGKLGETKQPLIITTVDHKRDIGKSCVLVYLIATNNSKKLETDFKNENKSRIRTCKINGKTQTEMIMFNKDFTIEDAKNSWKRLNKNLNNDRSLEHLEKMKELELEELKLKDKQYEREYQLKMMELKMKSNNNDNSEKNRESLIYNDIVTDKEQETEINLESESVTKTKEIELIKKVNERELPKNVYLNAKGVFIIDKKFSDKRICREYRSREKALFFIELMNTCNTIVEYLKKEKPSTKQKGTIYFRPKYSRWIASGSLNGKRPHIGCFSSKDEANKALIAFNKANNIV
jgi:hypothetical protein